jgi:hypothetical protein
MKIGIVVDGVSEYRSLSALYPQLDALSGNQLIGPLRAPIAPLAPPGVIARQCVPRITQLLGRGAGKVVVMFDRETRTDCAGSIATSVETRLRNEGIEAKVVLKNRMFENWLVADINAIASLKGRFKVSAATKGKIVPNKADNTDALDLLKRAAKKGAPYDKVADSKRILEKADAATIADNSRSFRKLLRYLDCEKYSDQSKLP